MTVSWTTKVEELGLAIVPFDQRTKAKELFAEAGKKRNGYVTIKMTLPERVGTDQQNRAFHALLGEYWKRQMLKPCFLRATLSTRTRRH